MKEKQPYRVVPKLDEIGLNGLAIAEDVLKRTLKRCLGARESQDREFWDSLLCGCFVLCWWGSRFVCCHSSDQDGDEIHPVVVDHIPSKNTCPGVAIYWLYKDGRKEKKQDHPSKRCYEASRPVVLCFSEI